MRTCPTSPVHNQVVNSISSLCLCLVWSEITTHNFVRPRLSAKFTTEEGESDTEVRVRQAVAFGLTLSVQKELFPGKFLQKPTCEDVEDSDPDVGAGRDDEQVRHEVGEGEDGEAVHHNHEEHEAEEEKETTRQCRLSACDETLEQIC